MDNLTHTLSSVLVAEVVHRLAPASGSRLTPAVRRTGSIALLVLGNNLPDADFLYSQVTGSRLDYLLQHRGHTHTLVGALAIALLLFLAARAWLNRRGSPWSTQDARYFGALALLGPLLHIALDFSNSYGVHPFWPLDNRWFYGDSIFIIEPLLWIAATPLLSLYRSRLARVAVALLLLAAVALSLLSGMVPMMLVFVMIALALGLHLAARLRQPAGQLALALGCWLVVTLLFVTTSQLARAALRDTVRNLHPQARLLDLVITPLPANPLCHEVLILQTEANRYTVRKAAHSLAGSLLPAAGCPLRAAAQEVTADWQPVARADTAQLRFIGEVSMPADSIARLDEQYCAARGLLRFARAPWWQNAAGGVMLGDLRYDREADAGFAEWLLRPGTDECPTALPDWVPPRQDLLVGDDRA